MVCGLASAAMIKTMASNLHIKSKCRKPVFHVDKPFAETSETIMVPCRLLFLVAYHHINTGITISKSKNQGWPKVIFLK
jgi:hypothetical protein